MTYTVRASPDAALTLNETDTVTSVLQNIGIILRTRVGNVPLQRWLGLKMNWLDRPSNVVPTMMVSDIKEAIERDEPRAKFVSVSFEADPDDPARVIPIVEVNIRES